MNRRYWNKLVKAKEGELGFADGYKFVYGPWATLRTAEVAFCR